MKDIKKMKEEVSATIKEFLERRHNANAEGVVLDTLSSVLFTAKENNCLAINARSTTNGLVLVVEFKNRKNIVSVESDGIAEYFISDINVNVERNNADNTNVYTFGLSQKYDFSKSLHLPVEVTSVTEIRTYDDIKKRTFLKVNENFEINEFENFGLRSSRKMERSTQKNLSLSESADEYFAGINSPCVSTKAQYNLDKKSFDILETKEIYNNKYLIISKMAYGGEISYKLAQLDNSSETLETVGKALPLNDEQVKLLTTNGYSINAYRNVNNESAADLINNLKVMNKK